MNNNIDSLQFLIICLVLLGVAIIVERLKLFISYKVRIKLYKKLVEEYDLDVDLPKSFKEFRSFNVKMLAYIMKNDILAYLFYLDCNNINGKISEICLGGDNNE